MGELGFGLQDDLSNLPKPLAQIRVFAVQEVALIKTFPFAHHEASSHDLIYFCPIAKWPVNPVAQSKGPKRSI
jgi:hypothetical protein